MAALDFMKAARAGTVEVKQEQEGAESSSKPIVEAADVLEGEEIPF